MERVLREELAAILSAWIDADPSAAERAKKLAAEQHADLERRDALRITLHWETDTYAVGVTYFRAGPMGVSRGIVVIEHPAKGGKPSLRIEPFCLLPDATQQLRHVANLDE